MSNATQAFGGKKQWRQEGMLYTPVDICACLENAEEGEAPPVHSSTVVLLGGRDVVRLGKRNARLRIMWVEVCLGATAKTICCRK